MTISTQPYKGARDFYPEDMRIRKYLFAVMRDVCEKYGYEEYDAPILEPTELYLTKGSDEIVNEQTYTFEDRGGRQVTLRTEMTPTVTRMVAGKRQELAYPLRWYSIPQCWRYERPQRGRGREFFQLNVDIFGVQGVQADIEIMSIADDIMQAYGAKRDMYSIKVGSRKLTNYILMEYLGLDQVAASTVIRLVDRKNKMEEAEFLGLLEGILSPSQRESAAADKLLAVLNSKDLSALPTEIMVHGPVQELSAVLKSLEESGITNIVFDPTLMRGFDYYTDIIFEVFDTHPDNNRSMFGGGRYDGLMELFSSEPVPTVGFGMGDHTLVNFLTGHELLPVLKPETELQVVAIGDVQAEASKLAKELRKMGVCVAVDYSGRGADKQLKTALKRGTRFVLFIGENEVKNEVYKLRDLVANKEESHSTQRIVSMIKDFRNQGVAKQIKTEGLM